jgi:hypothetical protein
LQAVIQNSPKKKKQKDEDEQYHDADGDGSSASGGDTGADLVLRNLTNGEEKTFNHVLEYYFSNKNNKLLMEVAKDPKDSNSVAKVVLYDCPSGKTVWLSKQGNDFKNFAMTDDGDQVAYVAERNAAPKDLQKFYKLWYFKEGMDSAALIVDKFSVGMQLGMTVSEFANLNFSKSGKRLFLAQHPYKLPEILHWLILNMLNWTSGIIKMITCKRCKPHPCDCVPHNRKIFWQYMT